MQGDLGSHARRKGMNRFPSECFVDRLLSEVVACHGRHPIPTARTFLFVESRHSQLTRLVSFKVLNELKAFAKFVEQSCSPLGIKKNLHVVNRVGKPLLLQLGLAQEALFS